MSGWQPLKYKSREPIVLWSFDYATRFAKRFSRVCKIPVKITRLSILKTFGTEDGEIEERMVTEWRLDVPNSVVLPGSYYAILEAISNVLVGESFSSGDDEAEEKMDEFIYEPDDDYE